MVGAGQRFKDAGYKLPKPLIEVDGVPMVVRVIHDLPVASRLVFVVNGDHVRQHQIDIRLKEYFPDACIVVADGLTEGQACSVQLGISALDKNEDVLVAACDNTHIFNRDHFSHLCSDHTNAALIWTYRNEPRVLVKPQWYGWVDVDAELVVKKVSVKVPLSAAPLNDHVVSGSFWFRTASQLNSAIDELITCNQRVNNEFYLDSVPNLMIQRGAVIKAFEVDKYIGWGTPADYEDYNYWSRYVRGAISYAA